MKTIKNEYRINYYNFTKSYKGFSLNRVFIYADHDHDAINTVMNTFNIPLNWIVTCGLWRKKVPVIVKGKNIYQYKKRNRKYSDHDIQMNQSLLLDKKTWY